MLVGLFRSPASDLDTGVKIGIASSTRTVSLNGRETIILCVASFPFRTLTMAKKKRQRVKARRET